MQWIKYKSLRVRILYISEFYEKLLPNMYILFKFLQNHNNCFKASNCFCLYAADSNFRCKCYPAPENITKTILNLIKQKK